MANTKDSGLDMRLTLAWYAGESAVLEELLPAPGSQAPMKFRYSEENGRSRLTLDEIYGLLELFPPQARARSILESVTVKPALWFHRDSIASGPQPTANIDEALSPTAIIPSYVGYAETDKAPGYVGNVELYELPEIAKSVARIVHAQGLVHEFGHCILKPEAFWNADDWGTRPKLRFPDGRLLDGDEVLEEYRSLADSHPPISHYASAYVGDDGKLKPGTVSVEEAMVEAMTAHLLGFAFQLDGSGLEPFRHRTPLREYIRNFLAAERVAT